MKVEVFAWRSNFSNSQPTPPRHTNQRSGTFVLVPSERDQTAITGMQRRNLSGRAVSLTPTVPAGGAKTRGRCPHRDNQQGEIPDLSVHDATKI